MDTPLNQLIFMGFWTAGAAFVAFLAVWRLRDGLRTRRFWHPLYQVAEEKHPTWFELEKAMTVMLAAVASLFFAIGLIVLLGLLFGKLS
ncbi:MAG: hypothetical protein H2049_00055 [Porphyrobacter sp.]|nr:hypothetical protein [Porphyrobacter sp.]